METLKRFSMRKFDISLALLRLLLCGEVVGGENAETTLVFVHTIDQLTMKTPNPKCRLYWWLKEFLEWDTVSHVGIFDPSCKLAPLYLLSSSPPPPLPFVSKYRSIYNIHTFYTVCNRGWGGDGVMWRAYSGIIHCVFDRIPNLQNCFTTPNKT